jgi:hypothetical protein
MRRILIWLLDFWKTCVQALTLLRISEISSCYRDNQESLESENIREVRGSLYDYQVLKDDSATISQYIVTVQAVVHWP